MTNKVLVLSKADPTLYQTPQGQSSIGGLGRALLPQKLFGSKFAGGEMNAVTGSECKAVTFQPRFKPVTHIKQMTLQAQLRVNLLKGKHNSAKMNK